MQPIPQLRPMGLVTVREMAGIGNSSAWARGAVLLAALIACALVAAPVAPGQTGGATPPGSRAACPVLPGSFSAGAGQFTMLIRINQQENVDTYTNFNSAKGGLGGRIQPQDIFVINTRFDQTTPAIAETLAMNLRAKFPCNRIIALNGLNSNPALPGYLLSLVNSPVGIYSVLLDYEQMDWDEARAQNPAMLPWTYNFLANLPRFGGFAAGVSNSLAAGPNAYARTGVVPIDNSTWNYGALAQTADAYNFRLGARHVGLQSVQTQANCQAGAPAFAGRIGSILQQYKFRTKIKKKKVRKGKKIVKKKIRKLIKIKKAARPNPLNLAAQISFNDAPVPGDPLPIRAVGATLADQCVAAGLARGQGAFFFFASDAAMKLLFQQPTVASLRPAFS
ncbi:MAG: hypothetical protein ABR536_02010 [Solirubrobacterales bacterium]